MNAPYFISFAVHTAVLECFSLSFCAAIFDSVVRVAKNMINPMGHLIM